MHAVKGILSSERTSGSGSSMVMAGVEMPLRGGGNAEFGTGGNDTRCS